MYKVIWGKSRYDFFNEKIQILLEKCSICWIKLDPLEEEFMRIGRIMNLEIDLQLQEIYW